VSIRSRRRETACHPVGVMDADRPEA
jgi:hypothetical protein